MAIKKNIIFFIIVFSLIFSYIPELLQASFLAGALAPKLTIYPLIFAFGFTVFYRKNFSLSLAERKTLTKFFAVYLVVMLLSLVYGLIEYPYYSVILHGPANQIEKLPKVYSLLTENGIFVTKQGLFSAWMLGRPIKNLVVETFWTFGLSILVYAWYKNDFRNGFHVFLKGVFASVVVVVLYGFLDMTYLSGSNMATNILMVINPLVHDVKAGGTWWPPLLWNGQLRSIFAEPSYYGIFGSFALPWIWYIYSTVKNTRNRLIIWGIMYFFVLFLFLTRSRTANMLILGEFALLFFFIIIGFLKSKKITFFVFLCGVLAFGTSLVFFNYGIEQSSQSMTAVSYMKDNIGSLANMDQRSNRSRYSIMIADLKIGLDHPFLGVGPSLRNAYIPKYLPDKEHLSNETKEWITNQKEKGILRSGFPELGEYTSRFAETGILGLLVFMTPPFYLIWRLIRFIRMNKKNMTREFNVVIYFTISFLGVLAAGIGDTLNIFYSYWLLLGLGYALLHHITSDRLMG